MSGADRRAAAATPPGRAFSDLPGWEETAWGLVWRTFHRGATRAVTASPELRPAVGPAPNLRAILAQAAQAPSEVDPLTARRFFEAHFLPRPIEPGRGASGFVTGYYEPVVEGSLVCTPHFRAPILPRPADLVTFPQGLTPPALPTGFAAGRRAPDGTLSVYPDRAALEAYALTPQAKPVVWLRDWTEVFLIHVQGSARVRLTDGSDIRLVYAGRNGHPYTSIGRALMESGRIAPDAMSLDVLKRWLRSNGQEEGDEGRRLMQQNRSYIFFEEQPLDDAGLGPTGGAGVPLTAGVSIAIDRTLWSYGLPFWIETTDPVPGFGPKPLRRLFIAQDTGSAILGPARADLFLGSGDEAGRHAGSVRHGATFTALVPRSS